MFSSRVPADFNSNALARAVSGARMTGRALIDLTLSNPTRAAIPYPPGLFHSLAAPVVSRYAPSPLGLECARRAVAADYARRGLDVPWDRICLTTSTSEAYSLLFKLLCEPGGDGVLVPVPSYPLFEHLTRLDGVAAQPYRLEYHGRWSLDLADLDSQWQANTRAVLAVSPNNPTGSVLSAGELAALDARSAARDAALIIDEVFADYPLHRVAPPIRNLAAAVPPRALTFRLGGLSKSAALPQLKLGWIAVDGPASLVAAALERLELVCDAYLSVSTPVQVAAADLIAGGDGPRRALLARIAANHTELCQLAAAHPAVEVLDTEAGWSVVVRIPARASEEATVVGLVEGAGVLVHPGYFFDFPHEAYLVLSLLPEEPVFGEGVRRMLEWIDG